MIMGCLALPMAGFAQTPTSNAAANAINDVNNLLPNDGELSGPSARAPNGGTSGAIDDDDVFYDAESLVPTTEMSRKTPRNMDPRTEPGSRMMIVTSTRGASTTQANMVSANRALKLGRYDAALTMFETLLKRRKNDVYALMGRAVALQNLGRYDEAIMAYDDVLDVRPDYKDARVNKMGLVAEKYPSVALRQLMDMHESKPNDVGVLAQLALTHAQLGQVQQALTYLGVAASKEPKNASHVYNMAIVADRAGMKKEAIEFYEEALEIDTIYASGRSLPRETVFTRLAQLR